MILTRSRTRGWAVLCSLFIAGFALGAAPITAVGPAEHKAAMSEKKRAESLMLPAAAAAARIALPSPSDTERGLVKAENTKAAAVQKQTAKGLKGRPLAIGYGRNIAAAS